MVRPCDTSAGHAAVDHQPAGAGRLPADGHRSVVQWAVPSVVRSCDTSAGHAAVDHQPAGAGRLPAAGQSCNGRCPAWCGRAIPDIYDKICKSVSSKVIYGL